MFTRSKSVTADGFEFVVKSLTLDESESWFGRTLEPFAMNRALLAQAVLFEGEPLGDRVGTLSIAATTALLPEVLAINGLDNTAAPAAAVATADPAPLANGHAGELEADAGPKL
jgi:hypothetical protein